MSLYHVLNIKINFVYNNFSFPEINELAVGEGKMELNTRDCSAAQICSLQPRGTIFSQAI